MGRTHIEVEDAGAYERAKDMLNAADIDPEAVGYISIVVEYENGDDTEETGDVTTTSDEEDESHTDDDERADTEDMFEKYDKEDSAGNGGGGPPKEPYTGTKGEGAVMPDTHRGRAMQALADLDDEWADARDVFEEVDHPDTDYKRTGNALSSVKNKTNYVKGRKKDKYEQGEPQNEYRITEAGKQALEAGRKLAEERKMT